MLRLVRLGFGQLDCANRGLLREELTQFVKGYNLLVLDKAFSLVLLALLDVFFVLVGSWSNLFYLVSDALMDNGTLEPGSH